MSKFKSAQKTYKDVFSVVPLFHKMLWLQGQTISTGTKSAACRHLAHMDRLSRQLNQHRGISRFGRRNVRDADGSDASPLPRALRRHLRAEFTSGPHIRASVCGVFFSFFAHRPWLWSGFGPFFLLPFYFHALSLVFKFSHDICMSLWEKQCAGEVR